ncbi:hypothetical protein IV203_023229 [Nitzschia inconspicua]|uniref:Uncharacterized protein n=1 Tax=Nitzschia inconspicua TaxID=303405 RepID=A0A9K3PBE7_9STRA|nr:hypothetical protein IV203_023229 [Nitzschia inconspicua]
MDPDKDFTSPDELQQWIENKGVSPKKAAQTAATLFKHGFDSPSTLIGISSANLQQVGIPVPVAQSLSNKLKRQDDGNFESFKAPTTKRMKVVPPKTADDLVQHCQKATNGKETGYSFELGGLINGQVIERNDTLEEVKGLVCKLLEASVSPQTQDDKAKFPIGCTVCGSGGGKSTLCALVEQRWTDDLRDAINNLAGELGNEMMTVTTVTSAFATFNSTCNYDNDEASRLRPEASLGIRLVASRNGWSHHAVSNFLRDDEEPLAYAHLRLREFLQKLVPEREDEAVIILIDEIMKIDDADEIHSILLTMSDFQQECLRNSRKLFVLVTSLTSSPTTDLTRKTQRRVLPISLPPISPPEVLNQAKLFAAKLIRERDDIQENLRQHLISEFCSSGGLVKNMNTVVEYFNDKSNLSSNAALRHMSGDYSWISKVLRHSIFGEPLSCSESSGNKSVEDLIFDHRVAVIRTVLDSDNCQQILVRVPTHILRSIGVFEEKSCDLTSYQASHLQRLMDALAENRQSDGSYAKPFEIAMMRVLCLRLSLTFNHTTLDHILPGCVCHDETFLEQAVDRSDCDWIEVEKLTEEEVKKQRKHGTMVYSKLSNEGALEGFWYLIINERPFVLFLQMKFWKYCRPGDIERWENSIHKRAAEYNMRRREEYAPLFFSTSETFKVSSSLAMPEKATENLLEPFGLCPMMLYAEERYENRNQRLH